MLLGAGEVDERPIHPLISQVPVPPLRFDDASGVLGRRPAGAVGRLARVAAEWGLGEADRSSSTMMVADDGDG